ncbi:MAG: hypothetical protein ACXAD7_27310, partial [Candidatus Kariarchaeaceae archaeon]
YLTDLRLEKNPSSSTPNTTWSLYEDGLSVDSNLFTVESDPTVIVENGALSLGGLENGVSYGLEVEFTYDPEIEDYAIANESQLLTLLALDAIDPLEIHNQSGDVVSDLDWTQPYPSSSLLRNQSLIRFESIPNIDNFTTFTVIYQFDFDFGAKNYANITLGSGVENYRNNSWIQIDLKSGFLPDSEESYSPMFVRFNKTITGEDKAGWYPLDYGVNGATEWDGNFIIYNSSKPIVNIQVSSGIPELIFDGSVATDEQVEVIYGVHSQYSLGYGFQKVGKSYSDSIRLIYNNDSATEIKDSSGVIESISLEDPTLYIGLDNSSQETVLELYNLPLLYAPEINLTIKLDPVILDQIDNFADENNIFELNFYYVSSGGYGSYYTDTVEIALNYSAMEPDFETDGSYQIHYNKDLQGLYEAFGTGSMDMYVSIAQSDNDSNYISYILLEQFDYLCDEHLVEMYARMPRDNDGDLDVTAVINTPHFYSILSRPFIDDVYGESPFDLLNNSEVTVSLEDLPYSSLVALEGESGDYSFDYLGTTETLPINAENYYMIPNLGLFTDAYDIDEVIYQDGTVNLYYGSGTQVSGEEDYNDRIYMEYEDGEIDDYESVISGGVPASWEDSYNITDQFLSTQEITVSGTVLYHQLFDFGNDVIEKNELEDILGVITGAEFGFQLPDEISIAHIRTIGTPYEYDLSIQGFPVGDYIDDTYCNVLTSGTSYNFDTREYETQVINGSTDYSLEFASNGSKYIVFYILESVADDYAISNKIMVDYWAYHTFTEGFDYDVVEDPYNPYVSVIDWDYQITSLNSYTMHPDFANGSSFTIDFSALEWNSVDNNYIHNGQEEFTFKPEIQTSLSVMYYGDENESF